MLNIIADDKKYLVKVQEVLREYILKNPTEGQKYLPFVDMSKSENQKILTDITNLFAVYSAISRNVWQDTSIKPKNDIIELAYAVKEGRSLSREQWRVIKKAVEIEIENSSDGIHNLDMAFFNFLRALVKIDAIYAEKIYADIYEKTGLYSRRILSEMTTMGLPYAYRVLTQRLLSVRNKNIQIRTSITLLKSYTDKACQIYENVKKINDRSIVQAGDVIGYLGRTGYSTTENTNNIDESHLHFGIQLIFDESQKEGNNEIWIDCYELSKFLRQHQSETQKIEGTKEWNRIYDFRDPAVPSS